MEYSKFQEEFNQLNADNKKMVHKLLQDMEHTECKKKIDYSYGLKKAKFLADLSWNEIMEKIRENLEKKGGDRIFTLDTIKNVVKRGSSGSEYFEFLLEVLEVSKEELIWDFWHQQPEIDDLKWCYESISPVNRYAVFWLMLNLNMVQNRKKKSKEREENLRENQDYDEFEFEMLAYNENFKDKPGKVSEEFSKTRKIPRYKRKEE